jgi:hypothetical protein
MKVRMHTQLGVLSSVAGLAVTVLAIAVAGASAAVQAPIAGANASTAITTAAWLNHHYIVNFAYGGCIDAPNSLLNVRLRLAACLGSSTHDWSFVAASSPNTYYLVNVASGYCAEVNNNSGSPGEAVDEWYCNGTQAEQWVQSFRVIDGTVYQQFRHAGTNQCLDTVGGRDSQLMQWYCDAANDAQTWWVW